MNLYGSICLTDIPKEYITVGNNGKKYLRVNIDERKAPDQYGNTHNIKVSMTKEQRAQTGTVYIGNLKPSSYGQTQSMTATPPAQYSAPAQQYQQPHAAAPAPVPPLPGLDPDLPF